MNHLTLVATNLARRPTRTTLTFLSLVIAFLLFMLLRAIETAFAGGVATGGPQRLYINSKYSSTDNLPMAHIRAIADTEGVLAVTPMIWFGGYYQDPGNDFPKLVVDHERYFEVYPEVQIDAATAERFERSRRAVLVTQPIADRYGWQVGDSIPIQGDIWPKEDNSWNWEFELAGSYRIAPGSRVQDAFLIRHDYFNESAIFWIKDQVNWAVARLNDDVVSKDAITRIDGGFENSSNPTRSLSEDDYARQFANQLGDIGIISTLILSAVFFTILLLTANVALMSMRERIPELAVMKTLGFRNLTLSLMLLTEALLLTLAGAIGGVLLGFAAEATLSAGLGAVFGQFEMTWAHALQALSLGILIGLVVGLPPALSAAALSISNALRERE